MNIVGITGQAGSGKDTVADHLVAEHGYVKVALADPIKRFGREVFGFTDTQLWGPSEHRNEVDKRFDYYCQVRPGGTRFTPSTALGKVAHDCDPGWYAAAVALKAYAQEWLDQVLPEADVQSLYDWFSAIGNNHAQLSPRIMLQLLGTEWGRQVADENIWVNCLIRTANEVLKGQQYDRRIGLTGFDPRKASPIGVVVSDVRFQNELVCVKEAGGKLIRVKRPSTDKQSSKTGVSGHASEMEQRQFSDGDFDAILQNLTTIETLLEGADVAANSWRG